MMRFVADAAPQAGEAAMRSGRQPEVRPQRRGVAGRRQNGKLFARRR